MGLASMLVILGIFFLLIMEIADGKREIESLKRSCPDPVVEMAEYRGVVHALDRCHDRLDEERDLTFDMKDQVDHWNYIARITHTVDEEINCMLLIERATRDFREQCEDDLYIVQAEVQDECWCPLLVEGLSELP
jgi:hypothetical protein